MNGFTYQIKVQAIKGDHISMLIYGGNEANARQKGRELVNLIQDWYICELIDVQTNKVITRTVRNES